MKRTAIIILLLSASLLGACNTMEVVNQSIPGHHAPVPFSHSWFYERQLRRDYHPTEVRYQ